MQPTENKQPAQEELIAHIRKNLKAHEEPYSLGAWERFNSKQHIKRTPIFWITRLGGVAAVIAVCFTLFLLTKTNSEKQNDVLVKVNANQTEKQSQNPINSEDLENLANEANQKIATQQDEKTAKRESSLLAAHSDNMETKQVGTVNLDEAVIPKTQPEIVQNNEIITPKSEEIIAGITGEKTTPNSADFLIKDTHRDESKLERIAKNKSKSKWVLGLMVAPSLGQAEDLNMGYGLSMGYNFSDKLSLVTGVSYNEMSASKDFATNADMSSILFGNNKSLTAISQKVTGLDIPLELKYSFNKNVYASLGVSAFAVIGQSRSNTFIQGVVVNGTPNKVSSSTDGSASNTDLSSSKGQFENTYILNKKVIERADLEGQNDVNYLGFYNFSIGYKKRMLKRHFVAFEPFVKLPIREVTQDNLRLVGAGLRLKVDF